MKVQLARAQALLNQKKPNPDEAMKLLQPLVNKKQVPWPVYHFSGIAFVQKKEYDTALTFLNEAQKEGGDQAETDHAISICYFHLGNFDEAIRFEEMALRKKPDFFKGWLHLGSIYRAQAKLNEALKCYQKANQLDPKSASVAYRIAEIYNDQGDVNKALELYNIAIKIDSGYSEAHLAKSQVLKNKREFDGAEEAIYQVLQDNPRHLGARISLAELHKYQGNYQKAIELYERMLDEFPKQGSVRVNYALCLQEIGRFSESEKHYKQAFKDQPASFEPLSNYLMGIHYNPDRSRDEIFEAHKIWDQHFAPSERPERPVPFNRDPNKRLRVGMISGGFRTHPVGWMVTKALENLPKDKFEVYCYTTNNRYDQITRRIHKATDKWQSVLGYGDEVIAEMIREDEIDILIELSGHSADTRLKTVALEPAPVIVKWVGGLFNTTGLQSVDFLITDHYETPTGEEPYYTEKLVRMPDDYIVFLPPDYAPEVGELPAKKNGYITFGCFNNPSKVNEEIVARWAEVMKRTPESRLFLKSKQYDTKELCDRIISKMEECGISKDRLIFEGLSPHNELLDCYNRVDIALDPWPYSGGLTTCEALWMGVPVVTKPGPTFAGRHSATHLENAGFGEWVADSWEEYTDTIVKLAGDIEKLDEIRSSMREKVAESPVCDGKRFGANLSIALREMWKQRTDGYEKGLPEGEWQDHIEVKPLDEKSIKELSEVSMDDSDDVMQQLDDMEAEFSDAEIAENVNKPVNGETSLNGAAEEAGPNSENSENELPETFKIEIEGGITVCTPGSQEMLTPYVLLEQGTWYEPETRFVNDWLKSGMTVVDAGAGFGVYALPAAQKVGEKGRVYAFEPNKVAHLHLQMSKLENDLQNLEVIGKAVYDRNGKVSFHNGDSPILSRLDEEGTSTAQGVTLDSWWSYEGEPKVDFLKLDINGEEQAALAGAEALLNETGASILIGVSENVEKLGSIKEQLERMDYSLFEYIPGPGLLTPFDSGVAPDPFLQNLVALKQDKIEQYASEGWIHDESYTPEEPEAGVWRDVIGGYPWSEEILRGWEKKNLSPTQQNYIVALNYLCAAEREDLTDSNSRSRKGVWILAAAQQLVQIYNSGENGLEVSFTLARVLNALGKRGQAVEVMRKLMETTKLGQQGMDIDLPFLPPLEVQDLAEVKTEFKNWLMVRTVEAWIALKDITTLLSGEQERKLMGLLEGNPEYGGVLRHKSSLNHQQKKDLEKKSKAKRPNMGSNYPKRTRQFALPELGVEGLFDALNREQVNYVVLRWFEDLPEIEEGEDLDLLIDDDDLYKLEPYFSLEEKPGSTKCDIYSASGIPGSSFEGLPYYEKRLADDILKNGVIYKERYRVADKKRHIVSVAYHAVFHKADYSGLNLNDEIGPLSKVKPDHDYAEHILRLSNQLQETVKPTLEGLLKYLEKNDWVPGVDLIRKLSLRRPWLRTLKPKVKPKSETKGETAVFLIREHAVSNGWTKDFVNHIRYCGFDVKKIIKLSGNQKRQSADQLRGGNWNRGPWPISGGEPHTAIIAHDYAPVAPEGKLREKHPYLSNARTYKVKIDIRNAVNRSLPKSECYNPLHSTDDIIEANEYIEVIGGEDLLKEIAERVQEGYQQSNPQQIKLHQGRRAASYIVYEEGEPFFLKKFINSEDGIDAFQSEETAMKKFKDKSWAPQWLELGDMWLKMKHYPSALRLDQMALSMSDEEKKQIAIKVLKVIKEIYTLGYAHRDLHAKNIFVIDGDPIVVDFETLCEQRNDHKDGFLSSYDINATGLESPYMTSQMCYKNEKFYYSLSNVLNVSIDDIIGKIGS
ncbi:MAG: FkbM family methyltransferase [Balneolaceae bacterium]|nr:FkbM family methyltransferase [Balneolaceae bacterium]